MRRRDTPFPHNCPLLPLHPCYVTKPVQQLPEPATLPWREITEIWLIRVAVALAAILELEYCSRYGVFMDNVKIIYLLVFFVVEVSAIFGVVGCSAYGF